MAFKKGTATNHADLLNQLVLFLTTDADLVAANQNYEVLYDQTKPFSGQAFAQPNRRHVVFKSTGLSGVDQIFSGITSFSDTANDYFNWSIFSGTGWLESSLISGFGDIRDGFINTMPYPQIMLAWDQAITYWFFANGRRWFVMAKVSTLYEGCGAGFILPPCPASEYRYPMAVWASHTQMAARWSDTSQHHNGLSTGRVMLREPSGQWGSYFGRTPWSGLPNGSDSDRMLLPQGCGNHLYTGVSNTTYNGTTFLNGLRDNPDGSFPFIPCTFATRNAYQSASAGQNIYGEAEGMFWVPSLNNGPEDEVIVDGVTYIIFQSVYKAGNPYMFALRV